jgi:hypothetical protein
MRISDVCGRFECPDKKQTTHQRGFREVGGTGLEPVTPQLVEPGEEVDVVRPNRPMWHLWGPFRPRACDWAGHVSTSTADTLLTSGRPRSPLFGLSLSHSSHELVELRLNLSQRVCIIGSCERRTGLG